MNLLLAAIAVIGVSLSGPLMAATAAPALSIAFWRNAAATGAIAPWVLLREPTELRNAPPIERRATLAAGIALAAHFAFWVSSLKLTSVASAVALVSMQVVFVIAFDVLRSRTASASVLTGAAVALIGVVVITGVDLTFSARALTGDVLALAGGFFAAVYMVLGAKARSTMPSASYNLSVFAVCAVVLMAVMLALGVPFAGWDLRSWLLIAAVVLSAQLLGHFLINHLLATMSATVLSLLLLLEVPGSALIAAIWLGQSVPVGVAVGLAMILGGLVVVTLVRDRATEAAIPDVD